MTSFNCATVQALEDLEQIDRAPHSSFNNVFSDHLNAMRRGGLFPESDGLPKAKLLPAASFARRSRPISDSGPPPDPLPTVVGSDAIGEEEVLAEAWNYAPVSTMHPCT